MHEIADLVPYEQNPVLRVRRGGETLRRRLEGAEARLDFAVLHELKASGATEYFALPVGGAYGPHSYMATYVTDRPGGFSDRQIAELTRVTERLSIAVEYAQPAHDRGKRAESLSRPADRRARLGGPDPTRRRRGRGRGVVVVRFAKLHPAV